MLGSKFAIHTATLALISCGSVAGARAETVMQQCGQQYQAAKAGGTLNGMTWNQFRTDCAAKLKAQPASATAATPAVAPAPVQAPATQTANPLKTAPTPAVTATVATPAAANATTTASPGRTAFVARERECGSEWRTNKVSLVSQTPGLTWPKYLSQCNARLKAAGK